MGYENCEGFFKKLISSASKNLQLSNGFMLHPNSLENEQSSNLSKHQAKHKSKYLNISSFLYFNALSIINKRDELDILLKRNEYDIVFISETWLKPFYPDCFLIDTHKFSMIRNDRPIRQGGGVCAIY